jgi:hypothetical protein
VEARDATPGESGMSAGDDRSHGGRGPSVSSDVRATAVGGSAESGAPTPGRLPSVETPGSDAPALVEGTDVSGERAAGVSPSAEPSTEPSTERAAADGPAGSTPSDATCANEGPSPVWSLERSTVDDDEFGGPGTDESLERETLGEGPLEEGISTIDRRRRVLATACRSALRAIVGAGLADGVKADVWESPGAPNGARGTACDSGSAPTDAGLSVDRNVSEVGSEVGADARPASTEGATARTMDADNDDACPSASRRIGATSPNGGASGNVRSDPPSGPLAAGPEPPAEDQVSSDAPDRSTNVDGVEGSDSSVPKLEVDGVNGEYPPDESVDA